MQATQPLDCSLDDDECLFRQLPLDGSSKSTEPSKAFSDDVIYTSLDEAVTGTDVLLLGAAVTVGMTLLFGLLLRAAGPGAWRYTVAGGSCAAISHMIPVPIDTVKTRKQIDPAYSRLHFTQALQSIVKTEGFAGLWVGLGPTAVGYALEGE